MAASLAPYGEDHLFLGVDYKDLCFQGLIFLFSCEESIYSANRGMWLHITVATELCEETDSCVLHQMCLFGCLTHILNMHPQVILVEKHQL